jgi:hypothetical protein
LSHLTSTPKFTTNNLSQCEEDRMSMSAMWNHTEA